MERRESSLPSEEWNLFLYTLHGGSVTILVIELASNCIKLRAFILLISGFKFTFLAFSFNLFTIFISLTHA